MEKNYDPKKIEEKWYNWWMEKKLFHGDPEKGGEKYSMFTSP